MRAFRYVFFALMLTFSANVAPGAYAQDAEAQDIKPHNTQPFDAWLKDFRTEAAAKGISQQTLDAALTGIQPITRVIELDRRQPEFTWTFRQYMSKLVNDARIAKGKKMLAQNSKLLNEIGTKYGIHPRFLVAFWGLETDFGRLAEGYFSTVAALATLAHEGRRGAFFREQLFAALKIIDEGHVTAEKMKGSWAGAMGHFQFIPTTFVAYAQDYDGDGKRDIWSNTADAYASAANFLTKSGWKDGEIWGREVTLPADFDFELTGLKIKKPLSAWQALGVRRLGGADLPQVADVEASVIAPSGAKGPAFLAYGNFRTIMVWNRSTFYALAVGNLADQIVGMPDFSTLGPEESRGLTFNESKELQQGLTQMGFETGGADGIIGPNSRDAIRAFQKQSGMTPDGHPTIDLLDKVRKGL